MAMINVDPAIGVPVEQEIELTQDTDSILKLIYAHVTQLYAFQPGKGEVAERFDDMIDTVMTLVTEEYDELDFEVYSNYLEHLLFRMMIDLNFCAQYILATTVLMWKDEVRKNNPLLEALNQRAISKFLSNYFFGESVFALDSLALQINSEWAYDDMVKKFDHIPDQMKDHFVQFLQEQGEAFFASKDS